MSTTTITCEKFITAAKDFITISQRICDTWKLVEDTFNTHKTYIIKDTFISYELNGTQSLLKAEFVIFYNLSYGVPSFSFNIWNSTGALVTLEDIRKMSFVTINEKEFYSVITQQEHPLFHRPYFVMHPCHTESLLWALKNSKNIIVTFLGMITPVIRLNLSLEYGL